MTRDEVAKLAREEAQAVYDKNEARYPRISSLPDWARGPVEEVYRRLDLLGTEDSGKDTRIDASETYARALVVIEKVLRLLDELEEKEP